MLDLKDILEGRLLRLSFGKIEKTHNQTKKVVKLKQTKKDTIYL